MGTRSEFTRAPRSESAAGSRVRAANTVMSTTTIGPSPMERKMLTGTSSMPTSATTVIPLKNTVRPAVSPVASMAATLSLPLDSSSRNRETTMSA